ncbi:MAG: efflux RND transporter periplasmic adaptor subunit [Myxococcales bacterium]|nr:efflux RND transporter periplasmic adaptor subunit [Myxococcales bacterium]
MRRLLKRPSVWIGLALVLIAATLLALRARGPLVETTTPLRQDLEQHIVSSGRVRVPSRVQVAPQVPGLVLSVGVVEGQRVSAGDVLVQLDDTAERAAVASAEAAVKQAKARVDQLARVGAVVTTQSLRQAEINLEKAESDLARTTKLVESRAVAAVELETARQAVELARAQRDAARAQQVASAPMGADARVAVAALTQAQAQLAAAEARRAQTRIVALHSGSVLDRDVEPGDVVQPSRTLLVLAADSDVELVFHPDEKNLPWIHLGQSARASADAYPQQVFDARVSYIAPSVDPARGSVEVRLAVPAPPPTLLPDMTVSVDLTVAAKRQVLTVPSRVVRGAATAAPYVLVVDDGRVVRRDVQLGIRGEGSIEIVGGLDPTSELIIPDGKQLAAGTRVRVERR